VNTLLKEELRNIFVEVSKLAIKEEKFEYVIYSNNNKIREPELRCLLSSVLSKKKIFYGIEVPTKKKYSFSKNDLSKRVTSARTDLAIYENTNPVINIELKEGLPTIDKIEKDFEKMFLEEVKGTSFFHVINSNVSEKTIQKVFDCYSRAHKNIKEKIAKNSNVMDKWFILYIFIVKEKYFYCQMFESLNSIKKFEAIKQRIGD
jgi:hypothetical protein